MLSTEPSRTPGSALEALLEEMRPRIRRVLYTHHIPPEDAEDLLQETLLTAFVKWDTILVKDAWFLGALRRKCLVYWRRRRYDLLQGVDAEILEMLAAPQPPLQEQDERLWDLKTLILALPPRYRAMMWLRYGLGLQHDEVADRLGLRRTSVRKLVSRMVERIQKLSGLPASRLPSL